MSRSRIWWQEWRLSLIYADGSTDVTYHPSGDAAWGSLMVTIEDYGRELVSFFVVRVK